MGKQMQGAITIGLISILLAACAGERPQNLGVRDGILAACPTSPNCVSSFAADEQHRIAPLAFTGDPATALVHLQRVLGQRSDVTIIEEQASYLRIELRTSLFVDDAEFLLDRERHLIHIRSASRLGYSDLGKNRSRMEEIRAQFSMIEAAR